MSVLFFLNWFFMNNLYEDVLYKSGISEARDYENKGKINYICLSIAHEKGINIPRLNSFILLT